MAYCPFSFCASSSACLKSFLIECHVRLTVESEILKLASFGLARKAFLCYSLKYQPSGSNSVVECQLPKLDVAGSSPVSRSKKINSL